MVSENASKLDQMEAMDLHEESKDETDPESLVTVENFCKAEVPHPPCWEPSGNTWKDFFYFCGPGWFVSIAYIDPGNYQADIQAGATSRYTLLFALWWTSMLSIYVQMLCVRLAYYGQVTLAEAQAKDSSSRFSKYVGWTIAEVSAMITDLPEVIGIGIALHQFFGWPYYAGVLLSLLTTMLFLVTMQMRAQILERIIFGFVGIMSLALWFEMGLVHPNGTELLKGWIYGFADVKSSDLFSIAGILGSVVMPHNLYLHTAAVQSRRVKREAQVVRQAVKYSSYEPVLPIMVAFVVNTAIVSIAAERVYGSANAANVGLTDFCTYFEKLKGGCLLWGIALLAAGQSSAITTTFTGQYIMDGFLKIRLPIRVRALLTRLVAIIPCVIISVLFPNHLNQMVNLVNASLSLLLPFAFSPLVRYNCSEVFMGKFASTGVEKYLLYAFAIFVWAINAYSFSSVNGGFLGHLVHGMPRSAGKVILIVLEAAFQIFYAWWNLGYLFKPVRCENRALEDERPYDSQFTCSMAHRH